MSRSNQNISIRIAETAEDLGRRYPVMHGFRLHIDARQFREQVRREQKSGGFRLVYLRDQGEIVANAIAGPVMQPYPCTASTRFWWTQTI